MQDPYLKAPPVGGNPVSKPALNYANAAAKPVKPTSTNGKTGYKYPRGESNAVKKAFPGLTKTFSGMVANAKKYARPTMPVKSKPVAGASNYNPQS